MTKAIADNDVKAMEEIAALIVKSKAERHKVEVEALAKEAEALAGVRQSLAETVRKAVDGAIPDLASQLAAVKCSEFRYQAKGHVGADGVPLAKSTVGLNVPVVKKGKGGTGGGGKTKDDYGMSLDEAFTAFANVEEQKRYAEAEAADNKHATEHGLTTPKQSNRWRVKDSVKKRAIAEGLLAPKR